ncbi:MAG TPA: acyl-CoA synthetase [Acidimicrobiales bacterium]|jgi:fatty-acyl-CoA synthase|nr:acyl-CoA synthetase [Acidimicrobiales bacterium]
MTHHRHLGAQAKEHPDRTAVIMVGSGEATTYRELDERSNRLAHVFRQAGLQVGDHLALMMENGSPLLEVAWAAQRAGLYYTALNGHLRRDEAQYILDDCGAVALVITAGLAEVAASLDLDRVPLLISAGGEVPGFSRYEDVLARGRPSSIADEAEGREMLYSSGTTGVPKGVRKALGVTSPGDPRAPSVVIVEGIAAMGIDDQTVYLSPAPLYHSAPLVYSMAMHRLGATSVVMESFDPETCLAAIERYRVTHAQFVPTMFTRILRLPDRQRLAHDISSLRYVVHAAAPCPVPVKRRMLEWWGPIIYEYYAGTEDVGSSFIGPHEWLAHPGSVGRPMGEMHIVGDDGEEVPTGQTGTVYFAGGREFSYHNDPDKTAAIQNRHGWRTLGDVGYVDEDGYLYLTDRSADMIVSGGVNIYPREAEQVLLAHPAVLDAAVFGVPDDEMGESVKAVVQLADPDVAVGEDELLRWCREHLARYKCPRSVDTVAQMPRDPSGKLFKRLLREPYWEGRSSRIV